MEKKIPIRTCIVCKALKPKKELARIVKAEDGIFYDSTGRQNGRGAYVCKDEECIKKLKKQKSLNRVFSCPVDDCVYDNILEAFLGDKVKG